MISTPRAPTGSYSLKSAHVTRDPYPLYSPSVNSAFLASEAASSMNAFAVCRKEG